MIQSYLVDRDRKSFNLQSHHEQKEESKAALQNGHEVMALAMGHETQSRETQRVPLALLPCKRPGITHIHMM